jgi:hypothetical protein
MDVDAAKTIASPIQSTEHLPFMITALGRSILSAAETSCDWLPGNDESGSMALLRVKDAVRSSSQ